MNLQFPMTQKHMSLTKMNIVVIRVKYQMIIMNENMNWMKLTHLLPICTLNIKAPLGTSTFTLTFLIFFKV